MWYPAAITAAGAEPITLAQAKEQCRIEADDLDSDTHLTRLITVARAHVEAYTGARLSTQTVAVKADCFADMARLPVAPVQSVSSIGYVDTNGAAQTLASSVYELRADGLETAIVLKYDQTWPSIRSGSRITLTAVVGYATVPESIVHALLLLVADGFHQRENVKADIGTALDGLLANNRRWRF